MWEKIGKPATTSTSHSARNASGDTLTLAAQFNCSIELKDMKRSGICYISNIDNLNLMGIDWIEKFNLWNIPISNVCNQITTKTNSGDFIKQKKNQTVKSEFVGISQQD